jgi:riboflavin biosynthesis pyrimidine reductase
VRFVLDSNLLLPEHSRLVATAKQVPVVIACTDSAQRANPNKVQALMESRVTLVSFPDAGERGIPLSEFISAMFQSDALEDVQLSPFTHLLVEPGPTLARSFFDEVELVDRVWVIRSPNRVNDPSAPAASGVPGEFVKTGELDLNGDTLSEFLNPVSPVFFSAEPSADFVLAREVERH